MDRDVKKALQIRLEKKMYDSITEWYNKSWYFDFTAFQEFIQNEFKGKVKIKSFEERKNYHKVILITSYSRKHFIVEQTVS